MKSLNFAIKVGSFLLNILLLLSCAQLEEKDLCGFSVGRKVPERVVCLGQHTTELLIKLGLSKKIVGWSFPDSQQRPDLPLLSQQYPSKEKVLALKTDFVYSGFLGAFKDERLGTRVSLKSVGIESYVSQYRCLENVRPIKYTDFFSDVQNIGQIFRVEKQAQALVDSLQKEFSAVSQFNIPESKRTKVVVISGAYPSGELLVTGGYDLSNDLINIAGGKNIFGEIKKQEFTASVEDIVKAKPDVIVLKESDTNVDAIETRKLLSTHPLLKNLSAVQRKNYVVVAFGSLLPSLNNIEALKKLAKTIRNQ